MSNKINAITVVLEDDVSEEYAEHIMNAILMLKKVIKVEANVADFTDYVAKAHAINDLKLKLVGVLKG